MITPLVRVISKSLAWASVVHCGILVSLLAWTAPGDVFFARREHVTLLLVLCCAGLGMSVVTVTQRIAQSAAWRAQLVHRGVSRERLFDALFGTSLGLGVLANVTAIGVVALAQSLGPEGVFVTRRGIFEALLLSTTVLGGAGLGACFATLRGGFESIAWRVIAAGVAYLTTTLLLMTPPRDAIAASFAPFVGFQLVVLAAAGMAARRNFLGASDLDRPLPERAARSMAWVGAATFAICTCLVIPHVEVFLVEHALRYPLIARPALSDPFRLVRPLDDDRFVAVDSEHESDGASFDGNRLGQVAFEFADRRSARTQGLADREELANPRARPDFVIGEVFERLTHQGRLNTYFDLTSGSIAVERRAWPDGDATSLWSDASLTHLTKPNGELFSERVHTRSHSVSLFSTDANAVALGDPVDGSLHVLVCRASAVPVMTRVELADGDRFQRFRSPTSSSSSATDDGSELGGFLRSFVVIGNQGTYSLESIDDALHAVKVALESDGRNLRDDPYSMRVDTSGDALRFAVSVAESRSSAAFHHEFHHEFWPRTLRERGVALALGGLAALRPPPLLVLGSCIDAPRDRLYVADSFFDPRARSGAGIVWIALALALAGFLSIRTKRDLARRGAAPGRWSLWAIAYFVCGPAAWFVYRAIETRQAYALEPESDRPRPRLVPAEPRVDATPVSSVR